MPLGTSQEKNKIFSAKIDVCRIEQTPKVSAKNFQGLFKRGCPSSAVNFISPPILLIYIVLGYCIVKRLFVQNGLSVDFAHCVQSSMQSKLNATKQSPLFSPLAPLQEAKICIIPKQDPKRVLPFAKLFITLWSREDYIFSADIFL